MRFFQRLEWLLLGGAIGPDSDVLAALAAQMLELENAQHEFQKTVWRIEKKVDRHLNVESGFDLDQALHPEKGNAEAEKPAPIASGTELTPEQAQQLIF